MHLINNLRIALFEPDIPQNVASIIRTCACFGINLDIIEPCGFIYDEKKIRRVAMDYIELCNITRHDNFQSFLNNIKSENRRLIINSTKASDFIYDFRFQPNDVLLFGRESAGVTQEVVDNADCQIKIPMQTGARSLNVAVSAAIASSEAIRQLNFRA